MRALFHSEVIAYSPAEAAKAFAPSCGEAVLRRALRTGEIFGHKIGPRRYILREDLIAFVRQQGDYPK
jgi:hypothetical protein